MVILSEDNLSVSVFLNNQQFKITLRELIEKKVKELHLHVANVLVVVVWL